MREGRVTRGDIGEGGTRRSDTTAGTVSGSAVSGNGVKSAGQSGVRGGGRRRARAARDVDSIVKLLKSDPEWGASLTHWHETPARPARTRPFPDSLDARIARALERRGISELFEHQARALELAFSGEDVLVATPTASGKTLCYTLPVLQSLFESDGAARALFLFPTKALGQDQSTNLTRLVQELGADWHAFTYDGDTPPSVRRTLRDRGHLILTNPWMLHSGILPNHAKWSELFRDLRYVVVDEVHTLGGVFGSSVANVLRRLVRIARHYGANPRFLASSATLFDPERHAARLFGRKLVVVDEDASATGRRTFGVLNPPMLNQVAGLRANALEEARRLAKVVCGPEHQTIFFCNRRTAVEVLTLYLKQSAGEMGLRPEEVRGYRGGYLPLLRREIEAGLRSGEVKVVVTTNALELGIDVGQLDVAVLVGYPGSQTSFWQRAGRVGRRSRPSLVVQIARSDPIDQYLARHPAHLFGAANERIGLDPDNLVILSEQIKCAAFELPFRRKDLEAEGPLEAGGAPDVSFGEVYAGAPHSLDILDYLAEESRLLHESAGTYYWMADSYPAQDVGLKGDDIDNVVILDADTEKMIGEIDRAASITSVHEGAIYLVEGETWIIERFDYKSRRAYARQVETDYFTEAQVDTEIRLVRLEEKCGRDRCELPKHEAQPADESVGSGPASVPELGPMPAPMPAPKPTSAGEDCAVWRGEVHVTTLATQYKKIRFYTRENVGADEIHLPPEELDTETFVLTLSQESALALGLVGGDRGAAWRGVGNLIRRVAPLFLRCRREDLGLACQVRSTHFRQPALFVYDRVQGGVGLGEGLFQARREVLDAAFEVVSLCECRSGCPACVGPVEEVGPLGKEIARAILEHLARGARLEPRPASLGPEGEVSKVSEVGKVGSETAGPA